MAIPKWANTERQNHLVKLFLKCGGFCVYGHSPCQGTLERKEKVVCEWGKFCLEPVANGEPCRYKPDEGKPHLPCNVRHVIKLVWHCSYGDYPCYMPFDAHYEFFASKLIKEWVANDRAQKSAEWQAERQQLHSVGERQYPIGGQFNFISQEIYFADQPQYYLAGLAMSGLTFKPFAKLRLASSFVALHIDLGDTLRKVSKSKRRKAVRYGIALPLEIQKEVDKLCNLAVKHYLDNS